MFHLFERVYLDHHKHISSKFENLVVGEKEGNHPISELIGKSVGHVPTFTNFLAEHHKGSIENFWQHLVKKDSKKRFVVYGDDAIFFQLLIQYWKSLFDDVSEQHLFFLYKSFRHDFLLKSMLDQDRGDNSMGLFKDIYKNLDFSAFSNQIKDISPSEFLRSMNKDIVSYEYLLGSYAFDKNTYVKEGFRNRVLFLGWRKWCREVNDMKVQIINMVPNLDIMFPDIKYEEFEDPSQFFRIQPSLNWIMDHNIQPESSNHIRRSYPAELFPQIQSLLDKYDWIEVYQKGIPIEDLTVINSASKTEYLYNSDFEKVLESDVKRGVGSSLFKGDAFFNANHYLINYIYDKIRKGKTADLKDFVLA